MRKVSVVIPTHNQSRFLSRAIDSALSQKLEPFEVIVVDDGSTDQTASVLAEYQGRIRTQYQENRGVAAARNEGAALASGELLAFLDSDDEWPPEKLERQVALFNSDPQLGLIHCGVDEITDEGDFISRKVDGLAGFVADEFLLFRRPLIPSGGSGALIPRAVFEELGGFDIAMSTSADWDLYYRIATRYKIGFVAEPLVRYRLHASNMHGNIDVMKRDMLRGHAKAFSNADDHLARLKRKAYGNLHSVLAGSFFSVGDYPRLIEHVAKSLIRTPGKFGHFFGYFSRRSRRGSATPTSVAIQRASTTGIGK